MQSRDPPRDSAKVRAVAMRSSILRIRRAQEPLEYAPTAIYFGIGPPPLPHIPHGISSSVLVSRSPRHDARLTGPGCCLSDLLTSGVRIRSGVTRRSPRPPRRRPALLLGAGGDTRAELVVKRPASATSRQAHL